MLRRAALTCVSESANSLPLPLLPCPGGTLIPQTGRKTYKAFGAGCLCPTPAASAGALSPSVKVSGDGALGRQSGPEEVMRVGPS